MSSLIGKLHRKFTHVGGRVVPFNSSLRPRGYHATIADYLAVHARNGATYTEIVPGHAATLDMQDPFYDNCASYLKPHPVQNVPPLYVVSIPNGRLYTDVYGLNIAVISSDNKVIGDVTYQYAGPKVSAKVQDSEVLKQRFFAKPQHYRGTVFSMLSSSRADDNYHHWLFDTLPKIYLLKESGWFEKVDWFLVPGVSRKFQRESLRLMGIDPAKMITGNKQMHIQADTLIVTPLIRHQGYIPGWACRAHQQAFARSESSVNPASPYIYIARGDAKIRQVLNEAELIPVLESMGFKTYTLSQLSFPEQISLFAQAKVIVAAHGAGLANLTFCAPGTHVIEFFPKHYVKPTFQIISKKARLNYHYLICENDAHSEPKNITQASNMNVYADVPRIRSMVEEVIRTAALSK